MTDNDMKNGASPPAEPSSDPWDQRLARALVRPLVNTAVTPNQLTTLRLLIGLSGCGFLAYGGAPWIHIGAGLFVLSNFVDHADGELARLSGKTSRFGHIYDLASDAVVHVSLFIAIGIGLRDGFLGLAGVTLGIAAGISVAGLFTLFQVLENRVRKKQAGLPRFAGFDVEDVLYLVGPIVWIGGLVPLLLAAALGAPLFGLWAFWRYRNVLAGKTGEVGDDGTGAS